MTRSGKGLVVAAMAVSIFASSAWGDSDARVSPGQVVYHYVGRVKLDFVNGTATIVAYVTHLEGAPSTVSLVSESSAGLSATFTIRADVTFAALPANGDIAPLLIKPGSIRMYHFTGIHYLNWGDPDTFSNGQLIAIFAREAEQLAVIGPIGTNTASAKLTSSARFPFAGGNFDIGQLIPRGVTNVTTGGITMLPGSTPTAPIFGFVGYGLAF